MFKNSYTYARKVARDLRAQGAAVAVGTGLAVMGSNANAAVDTAAALTGITDAGTAILAIVGALLALSVSIFGIVKVYNFMSKKAGG